MASCEPESINQWDNIYEMPSLEQIILDDYKGTDPKDICSDTFFFVDGEMIIHNKSSYLYNDKEYEASKNK